MPIRVNFAHTELHSEKMYADTRAHIEILRRVGICCEFCCAQGCKRAACALIRRGVPAGSASPVASDSGLGFLLHSLANMRL